MVVNSLAPTPAEFWKQRGDSMCFCAEDTCASLFRGWTYEQVLCRQSVCVWGGQLCSPTRLRGVAFVGVCAPSSSTSVYVCVHAYDTLYSNGLILGTCGLRCLMCIPGTRADLMPCLWRACQNRGLRIMPQASSSVWDLGTGGVGSLHKQEPQSEPSCSTCCPDVPPCRHPGRHPLRMVLMMCVHS